MPRIVWQDKCETELNDLPTTHVVAVVRAGPDFFFFIDKSKPEIEEEMTALLNALPKESQKARQHLSGEMLRVTNSAFIMSINPMSIFSSVIAEIKGLKKDGKKTY